MRERGNRSAGRGRGWVVGVAAGALALVAAGVFLWPAAEATPARIAKLEKICTSLGQPGRKAMAVDELRRLDSTAARARVVALADSADEKVAHLAISALGRTDGSAAANKLKAIYESTGRSAAMRAAALSAFCAREKRAGRTWANNRSWVRQHAGSNSRLTAQADALKAKLWAGESDE